MICNDTHGFIIIISEDRVGIGDADAGGYKAGNISTRRNQT